MFKKIIGIVCYIITAISIIGALFQIPTIYKSIGSVINSPSSFNFGSVFGKIFFCLLLLAIAYFMFKLGRKFYRKQLS